jgi:hypothetical protein
MRNRLAMLAALLTASLLLPVPPAAADTPFTAFAGAWSGSGSARLENGKTERLKCKGYYVLKAAGSGLGLAINCGNPSFKINMRANLTYADGQVSGTWEEREFNQAGDVSGKATETHISLSFSGAISGSMSVTMAGSGQTVSITTGGPGFTGVNLQFSKSS